MAKSKKHKAEDLSDTPIMEMSAKERFSQWPNLTKRSFRKTSVATRVYNCVSWALGLTDIKFNSFSYYWPPNLPREHTVDNYVNLYRLYEFEICPDGSYEEGTEKIALFGDGEGLFQHVSRQLSNGLWTSKMGELEDIEHKAPEVVSGSLYGRVSVYMKRYKKDG
jgi:hypothetical protein